MVCSCPFSRRQLTLEAMAADACLHSGGPAPAATVDRVRHGIAGLLPARRNDDVGAVLSERFGDRLSDASGGAGDERAFTAEVKESGHGVYPPTDR